MERLGQALKANHWVLNTLHEAISPANCTCNRRHVGRNGSVLVFLLDEDATFLERLVHLLDIGLEKLQQGLLLLFKLVVDDLSLEEAIEAFQKLEFADKSVTVVERLGKNGGKTSLLLLGALSELEEIVSELLLLNVHDVVVNEHELLDGLSEFGLNGDDGLGHGLTLGVANFNSLELVELDDRLGQLHDVLASLDEGIKTDKEGAGGDFPGIGGLSLSVIVGLFELGAELHAHRQLVVGVRGVFVFDGSEDLVAVDLLAALEDDCVADLTDQD